PGRASPSRSSCRSPDESAPSSVAGGDHRPFRLPSSARSRLRVEVPQFLAEPPQDPRLGDADGPPAHREFRPDVPGVAALDGRPPDRLTGPILELLADDVEDVAEDASVPVVYGSLAPRLGRRRELGEAVLGLGPPGGVGLAGGAAEVVPELVLGDDPEP